MVALPPQARQRKRAVAAIQNSARFVALAQAVLNELNAPRRASNVDPFETLDVRMDFKPVVDDSEQRTHQREPTLYAPSEFHVIGPQDLLSDGDLFAVQDEL